MTQSIYYAKNIAAAAAGANTVTVTFNAAVNYPDIRILEYKGVSTLDVTATATGNSGTTDSGAATTTSANELLVGANTVATNSATAGTGYTLRISAPNGDLAEDEIVTTTGTYHATASDSPAGAWVMQLVTFK